MAKLRSYILVGFLATTLAIPASAWHVHHDDDASHGNPAESCPVCFAVKTASTVVVTSASICLTTDISWIQTLEPEVASSHYSIPTANPRAPPYIS
jgi:hypothetical protein